MLKLCRPGIGRISHRIFYQIADSLRHDMSSEIASSNPVVKAVIEGTAPRPAQLAAARGSLPLPQTDLLEILVCFYERRRCGTDVKTHATRSSRSKAPTGSRIRRSLGGRRSVVFWLISRASQASRHRSTKRSLPIQRHLRRRSQILPAKPKTVSCSN